MTIYTKVADDGGKWVEIGASSGEPDAGLVHINTTTFSAVSSVSIDDVFTSDYENYLILIRASSAPAMVQLRMRAAGTDASGSNYTYQEDLSNGSTITTSRVTNAANYPLGTNNGMEATSLYVFSPQVSVPTIFHMNSFDSAGHALWRKNIGQHTLSTSYDGFSFISAAAATGTIRIYGYSNGA